METQSRRFLLAFCVASLLMTAALGLYNILVDPYSLFAFDIKSERAGHDIKLMSTADERLTKSYDVFRVHPNGLILGSSEVDSGLDATSADWPLAVKPVYNLGVFGLSLSDNYRYLSHVLRFKQIKLVVIGVGFDTFLGRWVRPLGAQELSRLNERSTRVRPEDFIAAALSFDALVASTDSVTDSVKGHHLMYVSGNHPIDVSKREQGGQGSATSFRFIDIRNISVAAVKPVAASRMDDLRDILQLCMANQVRVIVLINPVHAHMLEDYSELGYWQSFEDWKRSLVSVVTAAEAGGNESGLVELWDFSGYDRYSTTELPEAITWFWNSGHYTHKLGDLILRRLFVGGEDSQFGVRLTPNTLDAHLKAVRWQQLEYRQTHRDAETQLLRIYDETPH